MHETCLIVTCEHGGNDIPADFTSLFDGFRETLDSHRGYDPGALGLARHFADILDVPLFAATISRLLIDCNRSLRNRTLFSPVTRSLSEPEREAFIKRFYLPFRQPVEKCIEGHIREGHRVLHLSVHTFTPVLDGVLRRGDIGLLYDPARTDERDLCLDWQLRLRRLLPDLMIRRNYPYRGTSDGFVSMFRKQYGREHYLGCELEVNQKHSTGAPAASTCCDDASALRERQPDEADEWRRIRDALIESFKNVYSS